MKIARCKSGDGGSYHFGDDAGYFGWQDLSRGKRKPYMHGRANISDLKNHVGVEWYLLPRRFDFSLGISIGGDDDQLKFHIEIPRLFSFWLSFGGRAFRRLPRSKFWHGYETAFRVHDGYINIHIWYDEGIGKPSGIHWMLNLPDLILGRHNFSRQELEITETAVILPEAAYPVTVMMHLDTWKRPRWPWHKQLMRASVEVSDQDHGIPAHAGKGENGYDMDDDALFGMTCCAASVAEATEKVATSILRDRKKYGLPDGLAR